MKITQFSLRRYRAFDQETSFTLSKFTVLTGPNNLGKSTVLQALGVFFGAIQSRRAIVPFRERQQYKYEDDYPKKYEGRPGRRWTTRMRASLEFSEADIQSANRDIGVDIPSSVQLQVTFPLESSPGRRGRPEVEVSDITNVEASEKFISWFSGNFRYVYIPAVRDVGDFRGSVFSELVEGAILGVNQSQRRIGAIQRFYEAVEEQIRGVQEQLVDELRSFLPEIKKVNFVLRGLDLFRLISVRDVEVEDVANTSLSQKGDGFKSLFAMSVLQYMARQRHGSNLIFGIEEPEAHLHSSATYEIKNTLRTLSDSFQIVITTHSPILIQRDDIRSNIIVEQVQGNDFASEAKPARSLSDIRRSLGIRPQDNMMTAEVVLVVEGATEEQCLPALLSKILPDLSDHLTMGRVRVISAGGASKVVSVIRALARDAASCVVLFDSDEEGNRAFGHLTSSGLIGVGDVFQVPNRSGCLETEFEDVFPPELYIVQIGQACGISTSVDEFTTYRTRSGNHQTRMDKWSNVMQSITAAHGKMWNTCEDSAKSSFGLAVTQNIDAIEPDDYPWIRSIGTRIQMYLGQA